MGRIKTQLVKRITNKTVERYKDELSKDFNANKKLVNQYIEGPSKKIRNVIAGYITRLMNREA